jgi:Predicted membrane protein
MSKFNLDKPLSIILIIALIIAVGATIYIVVFPQPSEKFTEFYILGPNGKAGDYPTNLTAGESGNLTIGIVNHEYANTTYQLLVKNNQTILKNENITLANNEKREIPLKFNLPKGQNQKLEFLLYKLPNTQKIYRSLYMYVNVA